MYGTKWLGYHITLWHFLCTYNMNKHKYFALKPILGEVLSQTLHLVGYLWFIIPRPIQYALYDKEPSFSACRYAYVVSLQSYRFFIYWQKISTTLTGWRNVLCLTWESPHLEIQYLYWKRAQVPHWNPSGNSHTAWTKCNDVEDNACHQRLILT